LGPSQEVAHFNNADWSDLTLPFYFDRSVWLSRFLLWGNECKIPRAIPFSLVNSTVWFLAGWSGICNGKHQINTKSNQMTSDSMQSTLGMGCTWEKFSSLPVKKPQKCEIATRKEKI